MSPDETTQGQRVWHRAGAGRCAHHRRGGRRARRGARRRIVRQIVCRLGASGLATLRAYPDERAVGAASARSTGRPCSTATNARRRPGRAMVVAPVPTRTPEGTTNVVLVPGDLRASGRHSLGAGSTAGRSRTTRVGWVPRPTLGGYTPVRTRLVVDRARLRATLLRNGRPVFWAPVGIGAPGTTTPAGSFYVRNRLGEVREPVLRPGGLRHQRSFDRGQRLARRRLRRHSRHEPAGARTWAGLARLHSDDEPDILRLARLMPVGTLVRCADGAGVGAGPSCGRSARLRRVCVRPGRRSRQRGRVDRPKQLLREYPFEQGRLHGQNRSQPRSAPAGVGAGAAAAPVPGDGGGVSWVLPALVVSCVTALLLLIVLGRRFARRARDEPSPPEFTRSGRFERHRADPLASKRLPGTHAVVNQKGGVGKTTVSLVLGVAAARRGSRVLLVDLDPQASPRSCWGRTIGARRWPT